METIEPKERERIDNQYPLRIGANFYKKDGAFAEHLHLQNTVIEPLRKENDLLQQAHYEYERKRANSIILANNRDYEERISKLEAENKELREALKTVRMNIFTPDIDSADGESIFPDEIDFGTIKTTIDQLLTKNEG